jgi:hypothetical protein
MTFPLHNRISFDNLVTTSSLFFCMLLIALTLTVEMFYDDELIFGDDEGHRTQDHVTYNIIRL